MLEGVHVLLGVTGGIACYKSCEIVSRLRKAGAEVDVVMTAHACEFVSPMTFETLSGNRVVSDMFARPERWDVAHISLAKKADICVIAPASADILAKAAHGIADDMLSTTLLALKCPVIAAPAMNTNMYENVVVRENVRILQERGWIMMEAGEGRLACGDTGKGKMPEPVDIVARIDEELSSACDYRGKRVLVTAGATQEAIDGVRFLTNRSSGKMGIAIASEAARRGAQVTLVAGICSAPIPAGIEVVRVRTTQQMYDEVIARVEKNDYIVKAAAPADYRLQKTFDHKLKDAQITLELTKNPDIAKAVGAIKEDRKLIVFCAETRNLLQSAREKLHAKNADMVVANDVSAEGAGFDVDTNIATLVTEDTERAYPKMSKRELARVILDRALTL